MITQDSDLSKIKKNWDKSTEKPTANLKRIVNRVDDTKNIVDISKVKKVDDLEHKAVKLKTQNKFPAIKTKNLIDVKVPDLLKPSGEIEFKLKPIIKIGITDKPLDELPIPRLAKGFTKAKSIHIGANKKHVGWHSKLDLDTGPKPIIRDQSQHKPLPLPKKIPFTSDKLASAISPVKSRGSILGGMNSGRLKLPNIKK